MLGSLANWVLVVLKATPSFAVLVRAEYCDLRTQSDFMEIVTALKDGNQYFPQQPEGVIDT